MGRIIPENSIPYRIIYYSGQFLIRSLEKFIALSVPNEKYFETKDFEWIAEIEKDWLLMREELDGLLEERDQIPDICDISEEQLKVVNHGQWKSYTFMLHGHEIPGNCAKCPESYRMIKSIPRIKTAFFSILDPKVEIAEHRGPFKGYLRYHLGLLIPKDRKACALRLAGQIRHWQEGKSLVFDDTYLHDAWNKSEETRVVLFVDFIRDMPWPLLKASEFIVYLLGKSPFVQNALAKIRL